jgi:tetratricopeptide (TPR) repeat protein
MAKRKVSNAVLARRLHRRAAKFSDKGHEDEALALYKQALTLDFTRSDTHYNVGLIYKYRRKWRESLRYNRAAVQLEPTSEAANWNLAIAATALRKWSLARAAWQRVGVLTQAGSGPIDADFGQACVRLNADERSGATIEVVWVQRVCPVRARILNIPTVGTGYRYGDIVLHDGAATGHRLNAHGQERPIFNAFELFERSAHHTFLAKIVAPHPDDVQALESLADKLELPIEDWQQSIRYLCKACSEGRPHEQHDHALPAKDWAPEREVAFSAESDKRIRRVLKEWKLGGVGRALVGIENATAS